MQWMACRVVTGKEYFVRRKITDMSSSAKILVPRRYTKEIKDGTIRTKSEKMLPGYLLIGTEEGLDISGLKNFVKVLGIITNVEVEALMAQEGQKDVNLVVGVNILVIDGPFQGCKGKIQGKNEDGTVKCRLTFQGIELMADMRLELLSSISSTESTSSPKL